MNNSLILWIGVIIAVMLLLAILGNPAIASLWIKWKDPSKISKKEALLTYFFLFLPLLILIIGYLY